MNYVHSSRIAIPSYSFMQKTVAAALSYEQERVASIVDNFLSISDRKTLNALLEDSPGLYEITQLRREPKDFTYTEIKREIERGERIKELYVVAERLLPKIEISNESIKHYASLIAYYSVYKLKRFNEYLNY